ncbi:MAG TPA: response regulator [Chloroflexus aurantiacus]|jgi:CheY-like chemotaxis protein|uniref:Response regulator receiver n=1 Tax=Chloroflexus aurantiacus (strain ATCC 29366 / DSM 635 / J-10-fl) TaxID=324602 RepID=A9WCJ7_CHLAA|nr:response regulator [Chloroflexus aurantiacus]ABY34988.1 response regulator receiver [Chloroflexus aurantiacus J-10-fl]HBW68386.1 response regulator [Chloroflexus aurantiacus]
MAKILIVEDDSNNRDLIARIVELMGHQPILAIDGAQGVALARSEQPDLIIMDMGLPVLNGWQATHRIKSQPATRHIPVLALTAYAMNEDRIRSLVAGCDDFETKPIDFNRFREKVDALLARRVD